MEERSTLTIERAKEINILNYLADLGYKPAKIIRDDHWFLSPLRDEKEPSFKVNNKLNRWFDFGLGKGGNLIDFGILFHACTVKELLAKLSQISLPQHAQNRGHLRADSNTKRDAFQTDNSIMILSEQELKTPSLISYLNERKIALEIASRYCKEVTYSLNSRTYFAIGFKNDSGGFEIRNKHVKLSGSPKNVTRIRNGGKDLAVFEGFMDFLSFMAMDKVLSVRGLDYLILNSTAFFDKSIPIMDGYDRKFLLLDNDAAGQNCSQKVLQTGIGYEDKSSLYVGHKDLNQWLVKHSQANKMQQPTPRPRTKLRRGL